MAIQRRTAQAPSPVPQAPAPVMVHNVLQAQAAGQAMEGPNFLDPGFYSGGFLVPQGNYVISNIDIQLFKGDKGDFAERLGAIVSFIPLADPKPENVKTHFYSFGSEAHKSFMPNPAHGKGILPIPGAPSAGLNNSTNWFLFLKSMLDLGLPPGIATNNVSPLEGTWVYIQHIDEPAERASFVSKTAEVPGTVRTSKKIPVVGEILQGGRPWEGTGGWPSGPVQVGHALAQHINGAPAPALAPRTLAPPPPPPSAGMDMADVRAIALDAIANILEASVKTGGKTMARMGLRNSVFNAVSAKNGEQTAGAVLAQVFDAAGVLETVLGDLGCSVQGVMVNFG